MREHPRAEALLGDFLKSLGTPADVFPLRTLEIASLCPKTVLSASSLCLDQHGRFRNNFHLPILSLKKVRI